MNFEDTDEFYSKLFLATQAGHKVNVSTKFKSYEEMPIRLKKLLQIDEGGKNAERFKAGVKEMDPGYYDRMTMDPGTVVKSKGPESKYTREDIIVYLRKLIQYGQKSLELAEKEDEDAIEKLEAEVSLTDEGAYLDTLRIPLFSGHAGTTAKSISKLHEILNQISAQ